MSLDDLVSCLEVAAVAAAVVAVGWAAGIAAGPVWGAPVAVAAGGGAAFALSLLLGSVSRRLGAGRSGRRR